MFLGCVFKGNLTVPLTVQQINPCLCFLNSVSVCGCAMFSGCTDCQNAFALVVRPPTEQENLLFSFQLAAEDTLKSTWLKTLCRQVANTICRADAVSSVLPSRGIFLGSLHLEADKASSIIIYFIRPHFFFITATN